MILTSGLTSQKVYGEKSHIIFSGNESSQEVGGLPLEHGLAMIQGSSDTNLINVSGRLDFFTNKHAGSGLQNRMCILSTGYTGVNIEKPQNIFHVGPEYTLTSGSTASQTGNTVTLVTGIVTVDDVVGGTIIYGDMEQKSQLITSRTNNNTLEVEGSDTIAAGTSLKIHYPGLNVDSQGNVGIGTSSVYSRFHVEGPISTALKIVTSNYDITNLDSTIFGNPTSGTITVTLTNVNTTKGRKYLIKNISSNSVIVATEGSQIIDGNATQSLSQNKFIEVQSDGANWYIIGAN
jgi:hypothetical protein